MSMLKKDQEPLYTLLPFLVITLIAAYALIKDAFQRYDVADALLVSGVVIATASLLWFVVYRVFRIRPASGNTQASPQAPDTTVPLKEAVESIRALRAMRAARDPLDRQTQISHGWGPAAPQTIHHWPEEDDDPRGARPPQESSIFTPMSNSPRPKRMRQYTPRPELTGLKGKWNVLYLLYLVFGTAFVFMLALTRLEIAVFGFLVYTGVGIVLWLVIDHFTNPPWEP